jgi:hypothetical protein
LRGEAVDVGRRKALGIQLKVLGPEHPSVEASYTGVGKVDDRQGR